jgi:CRISPR-associated endonuclease/helicase Cas3
MERQSQKAVRLEQIKHLLLRHKDGLTVSEIARQIGVNRSTVWHYYHDADLPHTHYELGPDRRIRLNPDRLNFNINLDLNEALAIHLAVRMLSTRLDRHNPSAATAIRKISHALEVMAPMISRAMAQSADRAVADDQMRDPRYIEVLENLTKAWAKGRQIRLCYDSERSGEDHEYTFCPYFIEPYAIGQTTYVIGKLADSQEMRTFKIQRIRKAELLPEPYTIPDTFDPDEYLQFAWGIWTGSGEPVEVVLRFSPRVAKRVKETRWHRKQQLEDQADGSVIWRAKIAEPREMVPWVLGWGREVEALEPGTLRDQVESRA